MNRILIIKPQNFGDLFLLTPILSALKNQLPGVRIEILVRDSKAKILKYFPTIVDRVWTITGQDSEERLTDDSTTLLEQYFDEVIELSGLPFAGKMLCICKGGKKHHCRPSKRYGKNSSLVESCSELSYQESWKDEHAMERDTRVIEGALGVQLPRSDPVFPTHNAEFPKLAPPIQDPFAVFQTRSDDPARTWPRECWRTLAMRMLEKDVVKEIVIPFGSDKEGKDAAWITNGISGCRVPSTILPFDVHAALVQKAVVCVTCNTGVMHIAAALKTTPIVAVWGDTKIRKWYPLCSNFRIVCENEIINEDSARNKKAEMQEGLIENNSVEAVASAIGDIFKNLSCSDPIIG